MKYRRIDAILNDVKGKHWVNYGYWDNQTGSAPSFSGAAESLARFALSALQLQAGDAVLDLGFGCGDSLILWKSMQPEIKVEGCSPELDQFEVAQRKIIDSGLNSSVVIHPETAEQFLLQLQLGNAGDSSDKGSWSSLGRHSSECSASELEDEDEGFFHARVPSAGRPVSNIDTGAEEPTQPVSPPAEVLRRQTSDDSATSMSPWSQIPSATGYGNGIASEADCDRMPPTTRGSASRGVQISSSPIIGQFAPYNTVIALDSLYHMRLPSVLPKISESLKDDGHFVGTTLALADGLIGDLISHIIPRFCGLPGLCTQSSLKSHVRSSNFKNVAVTNITHQTLLPFLNYWTDCQHLFNGGKGLGYSWFELKLRVAMLLLKICASTGIVVYVSVYAQKPKSELAGAPHADLRLDMHSGTC